MCGRSVGRGWNAAGAWQPGSLGAATYVGWKLRAAPFDRLAGSRACQGAACLLRCRWPRQRRHCHTPGERCMLACPTPRVSDTPRVPARAGRSGRAGGGAAPERPPRDTGRARGGPAPGGRAAAACCHVSSSCRLRGLLPWAAAGTAAVVPGAVPAQPGAAGAAGGTAAARADAEPAAAGPAGRVRPRALARAVAGGDPGACGSGRAG